MRNFGWEPVVYTANEMPVIGKTSKRNTSRHYRSEKHLCGSPTIFYKSLPAKKEDRINASFLNEGKKGGFTQKAECLDTR